MYISDNKLEELVKTAVYIVDNNSIKNAMRLISQLENPITHEEFGTENAFKLYVSILKKKMKYQPLIHDNHVSAYLKPFNKKINEARKYK